MLSKKMREICDNFLQLKRKCYTMQQIADMYEVSVSSLYKSLGEFAKVLNCSREDLLIRMHVKPSKWSKKGDQSNAIEENIRDLMTQQEHLISYSNSLSKKYEELLIDMSIMQEELLNKKKEYDNKIEQLRKIDVHLSDIYKEFDNVQNELADISIRLSRLEDIRIYVNNNGHIHIDGEFIRPKDEYEKIYSKLLNHFLPLIENLTLKQIRQLSELILIVKSIIKQKRKYEIFFYNEDIKKAFLDIMNK